MKPKFDNPSRQPLRSDYQLLREAQREVKWKKENEVIFTQLALLIAYMLTVVGLLLFLK